MARNSGATKFASVNLNQSYGKPPPQQQPSSSTGTTTARSRLPGATHGGMLLLTRPTRPQPPGQKNFKLAVPGPVNLPSLRREHSGNDPTVLLVGVSSASRWIKQQQQVSEDPAFDGVLLPGGSVGVEGSIGGKTNGSSWGMSPQSGGSDAEFRPQGGRTGVYTPPGARLPQSDAIPQSSVALAPLRPPEKAVLLRGEEFPTLQAALPPATAPLQQQRQKELQQKQRDKQKELKEQQKKLQQLTVQHQDEEAGKVEQLPGQPQNVLSLQPQSKNDRIKKSQNAEKPPEQVAEHAGKQRSREEVRSLPSGPAPLIRLNLTSHWADDERDVSLDLKAKEVTINVQEASYLEWIDRDPEFFGHRRPEFFGHRRPLYRDAPPNFGKSVDSKKGVPDSKDHTQGRVVDLVKEHVSPGNARDSSFRKDITFPKDSALNTEGGYGRGSFSGAERTYGRANVNSNLGTDGGTFMRDPELEKSRSSDGGVERVGGFSRGNGLQARDAGVEMEMNMNKELYPKTYGSYNKVTSRDHDSRGGRDDYVNGRMKNYEMQNHADRLNGNGRGWRDSYAGMKFQSKNIGYDREGFLGRDEYNGGFSLGRSSYCKADFNTPVQNGDFGGGKASTGVRDNVQDFGMIKMVRSEFSLDNGRGRIAGSKFYSSDPFTIAFTEFVGVDYRAPSALGLDLFDTKGLQRKKEVKESNYRDLERESFEAELEGVQKLLEEERQRKIEEQERAIELARKEQEECERLEREEEERKRRLEEEAREAAAKAEQEAIEAARRAEELRRAREQEKHQMLIEEERRKENARRKLLELEERIAKREAESRRKEEEEHEQQLRGDRAYEANTSKLEGSLGHTIEEGVRGKSYFMDPDDDDRTPLRPPLERSSSKLLPSHNGSYQLKSSDEANRQFEELSGALQHSDSRSVSLEPDTGLPSSWRRGPSGADLGTPPMTKRYTLSPDSSKRTRSSLPRDRKYYSSKFDDWESTLGSSDSYIPSSSWDRANPGKRRDRVEGIHERRYNMNDDVESPAKFPNDHLRYGETDQGFTDNFHAIKDGENLLFRNRVLNHSSWEGRPPSPLSPSPYYYGTDLAEDLIPGRLRQSLPKQPRVPPPLQAYQKPVANATVEQLSDFSTGVHDEKEVYVEQESLKQQLNMEIRQTEDLSHQPLSAKLQQEAQSNSSEPELDYNLLEKSQDHSPPESEPNSSSERVVHNSTLSSKFEPLGEPVVESEFIKSIEEDSGDDGDEELLEDSGAAEFDEDEVSYGEKGETEEEDCDDLADERVVGYHEDFSDECQASLEGELSSGEGENSKSDEAGVSAPKGFSNSEVVCERGNDASVIVDTVNTDELLESISTKEPHSSVSSNDLPTHDATMHEKVPISNVGVVMHDKVPKSNVGVVEQHQLPLEVHSKKSQDLLFSPSLTFQSAELGESQVVSSSISLIQEQYPDYSTMTQPATFASATSMQVSSLHAGLPVVQNHLEVPMTLQFGLLPSTSLLPASVPAIQIGSIQMPLPVHMHSHLSPHVTHYHPSHASPFQFGQLGHPFALSQLLPSFGSQPQPTVWTSVPNENVEQQSVARLQYVQDVSDKTANICKDEPSVNNISGYPENETKNQTSIISGTRDSQVNSYSADAPHKIVTECKACAGHTLESGTGFYDTLKMKSEHMKNEHESLQKGSGSSIQSEVGKLAHGTESEILEKKEKDLLSHGETPGYNLKEARSKGVAYRGRPSRRNITRRSEFRPREIFLVDERSGSGSRQVNRQRFAISQGAEYSRNRSTNNKASQRDGFKSQIIQEKRLSKDGTDNAESIGAGHSRSSGLMNERVRIDSVQRNLITRSGGSMPRSSDGLVGKFGTVKDVPVQSGVVRVFEQPGIEIPGDDDDFIEVRSKRKVLNDRRERREKEIKAKSKAKEQVARKQKPSSKQSSEGDVVGPKLSVSSVSEKKNGQVSKPDSVGSGSTRYIQSGASTVNVPVSFALGTLGSQTLSATGTATSLSDAMVDKKSKVSNSGNTTSAAGLQSADDNISSSPVSLILTQDDVPISTHAWGGTRSSHQVVSLTQIQLEEVLKPVRYDLPLQPQLSLGEHGIIGLEGGGSNSSVLAKERSSASVAGSILPPLNGEKIQFGAVTSTYVSPISRPNTPSILGVVGSSLTFRSDAFTESSEMKKKVEQLTGTEDDGTTFGAKGKQVREGGRRNGATLDSEAEAEAEAAAAASAVAVAAISNDDPVHNADYVSSQSNVSGISNQASLNGPNLGGHISSSGSNCILLGVPCSKPLVTPASGLEDSMTVALPADLSVEAHSFSFGGAPHSGQGSSGLLLPSVPLPSLPTGFPALDLGPVIGGHMFTFGAGSDVPTGFQGAASGSIHEQGAANLGLSLAGWQQHVGGSDSYYGAPHGFAGPFMSPTGAVPNLQAPPHHMLVYTNPFGSIGQFSQLGVSFMSPTYIQSGKQPDWTHTPAATTSSGLVSMSTGELGGSSVVLPTQRSSSGVVSPIQRLAPGPSVAPVTHPSGPFDFSREATFQIPTVEVSMQPHWSHISVPHLQSTPASGPLLGYSLQSRQTHGPLIPAGHLQHVADSNNLHMVSPYPVSTSSFQSVDASAQFPDELGLGDSISTASIPDIGQELSSKEALGSAVSSGISTTADAGKMQCGRRAKATHGGSAQGTGEGTSGSAGLGPNSVAPIGKPINEGRSSPGHLQPHAEVSWQPLGHQTHHVGFTDQKATSQILRPGLTAGWAGQGSRKVGVTVRPQSQDRGVSSERVYVSSAKLKQVYVVKPSTSYKADATNSSESAVNMLVHEIGQTGVDR